MPIVGDNSPVINFSNVDLPAPFGPTNAIRLSQSTPSSRFSYKKSSFLPLSAERNVGERQNRQWDLLALGEIELEVNFSDDGRCQASSNHLIDNLLFGLNLACACWVTYTR